MADAEEHRIRQRTSSMLAQANLAMQDFSREQVEIFGEITAAVTSTLDLSCVLEILMEKIDQLLPYAAIMILLKTKSGRGLERVACRNIDEVDWRAREVEAAPYFSRTVLETGRALLVDDVQTDPRAVDPEFFRYNGLHSYLGIPLLANGEAIGVLSFLTKEAYRFSNAEIDFLTTLSGQAAIAIHHSQLYEELQTRSDALANLYGVTAEVNESLDLDPVLKKIMARIKDVFHFDATGIYFFNPESQLIERRAAWEASAGILGSEASVKAGEGLVGEVMETGQHVLFTDIREEPGYRTQSRSQAALTKECAFVGLPIKSQRRTVGVLVGAARSGRELDEGELELLSTIANQIGVAHEKSVLFYETNAKANQLSALCAIANERARELESLVELNSRITALLDRDILLPRIAEQARKVLDVTFASFRLIGDDKSYRVMRPGQEAEVGPPVVQLIDQGLPGVVIRQDGVVQVRNIAHSDILPEETRRRARELGHRSYLGVPLRMQDSIIGTLNCFAREERVFHDHEINLMTAFATQATIAIENANLFAEIKDKADELERVNADLRGVSGAKSHFVSVMSYKLRTELHTIMGHVELLLDGFGGVVTDGQRRGLETVRHHSQALLGLINNLLTLSRIEAGKMAMEASARPLEETLKHVRGYVEQLNRRMADDDKKICKCGHRESIHALEVCAVQQCDCRHYEPAEDDDDDGKGTT